MLFLSRLQLDPLSHSNMKKIIMGLLAVVTMSTPALADPKLTKGYYTLDALGCMLLRECTDGVKQVYTILDISSEYPNIDDFYIIADEFNNMLLSLNKVGVKVFLAEEKYFPPGHRGVYHTVGNNFFLNKSFMTRPSTVMSVMRHEGWHAAQDCMAGTIDNSMIALIMDEEKVPTIWQKIAEASYTSTPHAIPWEKEATWAGKTAGMTQKALAACADGEMWKVYEPTPLTRKWLIENNYIDK